MKHNFIFIMITALVIFLTSCQTPEKDKETSKEIVSYDYKYKIDVPVDWEVPEKKGELCGAANIEAYCMKRNACLVVIVEELGDDYLQFDNFCTLAARKLNKDYYTDVSAEDFKDTEICGNQAKYVEIKDVSSPLDEGKTENIRMFYYLVSINGYYTQFYEWTSEDEAEKNRDELNMIINSFTVFKLKNN